MHVSSVMLAIQTQAKRAIAQSGHAAQARSRVINGGAHPKREELLSLLLEEEEEDDELLEEEEVPSSSSPLCASSSASAAKSGRSLRICTAGIFDDSQMPINVTITPQ